MVRVSMLTVPLVLAAALPLYAGYDDAKGNDGIVYDGAPLDADAKKAVKTALDALAKIDKPCADCLRAMLEPGGGVPPRLCGETAGEAHDTEHTKGANQVTAASARRGPDAACNDGVDAINVNPKFLAMHPGILKSVLGHEWCHLAQDPDTVPAGPIAELPCFDLELQLLEKNKDDATTQEDKDAFANRIVFIKSVVIPALKAKKEKALKKGKRTKKQGGQVGYSESGDAVGGNQKRPFLVAAPAVASLGLQRYRLVRSTPPASKVTPLNLVVLSDRVLVSGVDASRTTGVVKGLTIAGGRITGELFELVLPDTHPLSFAWNPASRRLFILDTFQDRVLCVGDSDADGAPDAVGVYATTATVPAIATAWALGLDPDGDGDDILLSSVDTRLVDTIKAPDSTLGVFDDDGDCVADRTAVVILNTTSTTTPTSTSTTTSTTSTTLPGCVFDTGTSQCTGMCSPSTLCLAAGGSCQCASTAAACAAQGVPVCGGLCASPFAQCLPSGGVCACQ